VCTQKDIWCFGFPWMTTVGYAESSQGVRWDLKMPDDRPGGEREG